MIIRNLFQKKIDRPINGVIKADQRESDIWQELDEYVVTKQLNEYFRRFFDNYLAGYDRPNDPVIASRMGVWVSGFFGSGKSHFIKILSYLLQNIEAIDPETSTKRRAVDFFDETKVTDSMLLADIRRATQASTDVILFNIDAKADSKTDRDVIVQVFLRVFNTMQGFSGDAPHIAQMERHLVEKNVYEQFKQSFTESNGRSWESQRDAVGFYRDDVIAALSKSLSMSEESAGQWFDKSGDDYRINIEGFANIVRDYLNSKPAKHRIVFLVDEVGQFIGDNTQLMLNLQTITEELGSKCGGRAWIIVTSQEDIDAAIGEANKARTQDFSKIQGRFHTRLSLASSNTDEVIGKRLLAKTTEAHDELRDDFIAKGDIINNQLAFSSEGVTLRGYRDSAEYVNYYPFAPYQFTLLSKIFEAIRRHGATGRHLSKGERSLLDAFQTAAKQILDSNTDCLVPLYDFYASINSFLDSTVRHAIDKAENEINGLYEVFDVQLLKTLFLIKYIPEIIKGSVDNLATLCVSQIDQDKLVLKRNIQESLARLEKQNLVSRNGDDWMFLTNEEQDIAREIAFEVVSSDELSRTLSSLIFDEVLRGQTKVRHRETKADYEFNRIIDAKPYKSANNELSLEVITEFNDDYKSYTDAKLLLHSTVNAGRAVLALAQGERIYEELQVYLRIEQFIVNKYDNVGPAGKKILSFKKEENRDRYERLKLQMEALVAEANLYVLGAKVPVKTASATAILDEAINYLVSNTYSKLGYLKPTPNAFEEIRSVLTIDAMAQRALLAATDTPNALALKEVASFLHLKASKSAVLLEDVVKNFSGIPFGWKPDWEIVLLVARLFMSGEISLMMDSSPLTPQAALEPLTKTARFKQVSILKRKKTGVIELKKARDLFKDLFAIIGEEEEDQLVVGFRHELAKWDSSLTSYLHLASQTYYPGSETIEAIQGRISRRLAIRDSAAFLEEILSEANAWRDAADDLHDLQGFYNKDNGQIHTWRKLVSSLQSYNSNRDKLIENDKAAAALRDLEKIRETPAPYGQVNRIEPLLAVVDLVNQEIVGEKRSHALNKIDEKINAVKAELTLVSADADLSNKVLRPLQVLRGNLERENSIPQIFYMQSQAAELMDDAVTSIFREHEARRVAAEKEAARVAVVTTGTSTDSKVDTESTSSATPTVAPQVTIKPTATVRAASFSGGKPYLETTQEVDAYVNELREKLLKLINDGQRVRVE